VSVPLGQASTFHERCSVGRRARGAAPLRTAGTRPGAPRRAGHERADAKGARSGMHGDVEEYTLEFESASDAMLSGLRGAREGVEWACGVSASGGDGTAPATSPMAKGGAHQGTKRRLSATKCCFGFLLPTGVVKSSTTPEIT
jgi:hypothetical protein